MTAGVAGWRARYVQDARERKTMKSGRHSQCANAIKFAMLLPIMTALLTYRRNALA